MMKKTLIAGLLILVTGLIVAAVGLGHSGFKPLYWDSGIKIDKKINTTQSLKGVNQVLIDFRGYRSVLIKRGAVAEVSIHSTKSENTKATISNHVLKVTNREAFAVTFQNEADYQKPAVVITVPEKMTLEKITSKGLAWVDLRDVNVNLIDFAQSQSGMTMKHVTMKRPMRLKLDSGSYAGFNTVKAPSLTIDGSGYVEVKNSRFEKGDSKIRTTNGDVRLSHNDWRGLNVRTKNGDIHFHNQRLKTALSVRTDLGDINGVIAKDKRNYVVATAKDGKVTLYGKELRQVGLNARHSIIYRLIALGGDIEVRDD